MEKVEETVLPQMPSYFKNGRFYINAPYKDHVEVRKLGGYWDAGEKKWYFTKGADKPKFEKWLDELQIAEPIPEGYESKQQEQGEIKDEADSADSVTQQKLDKTDELIKKLEEGIKNIFTSEKYSDYLKTIARFPSYSFSNTVLIYMTNPNATLVTTYAKMKSEFGYHVKEGEHGIHILRPNKYSKSVDSTVQEIGRYIINNGESRIGQYIFTGDGAAAYNIYRRRNQDAVLFRQNVSENQLRSFVKDYVIGKEFAYPPFLPYSVFDISQASPIMIKDKDSNEVMDPKAQQLTLSLVDKVHEQDIKEVATIYEAVARISDVPIQYDAPMRREKGYYSHDGFINITNSNEPTQALKTLVHEITHSRLHSNQLSEKSKRQKKVEAESVAYVICQYYGIDTSDYSFGYVAGWSDGKELNVLKSSFSTIQKESYRMISEINQQLEKVRTIDLTQDALFLDNVIFKNGDIIKDELYVPEEMDNIEEAEPDFFYITYKIEEQGRELPCCLFFAKSVRSLTYKQNDIAI